MIEVNICPRLHPSKSKVLSKTPQEALNRLIKYELGYGSMLTNVSEVSLTVECGSMNCCSIFSGSKDEMRCLLFTAYFSQQAEKHDCQIIDSLVEGMGGNHKAMRTYYLGDKAPLVSTHKRLRISCMLGMGVTKAQDISFG